jgi:aryl-phospho-beta-D-glucosidase BglC (GH1 family)
MNKKILSAIVSLSLIAAIIVSCGIFNVFADNGAASSDAAVANGDSTVYPRAPITDEDFITIKGEKFFNQRGEEVVFRGTNVGGWLIQEEWICPTRNSDGQYDILTTLTNRFGAEEAERLISLYEDNWFTEYDMDIIANMGFNCIRVPFWYRNLQSDDNGTWKRTADGQLDFSRLDWIVEQAGKRGIYVIIDLHGAVGRQSNKDHSGLSGDGHYFDDTPEGDRYRYLTCNLWVEVAKHFRHNPVVAAYDLMNEPMCDWVPAKHLKLWQAYDELYDAVRRVDLDHSIIMCCTWTPGCVPNPNYYGWTTWSYKGYASWATDWFIVNTAGSDTDLRVDIDNDSVEEIERKWGEALRTENSFKIMQELYDIQVKYATGCYDRKDNVRYYFHIKDSIAGILAYFGIHIG